jgi:outer membrane immunogenic protein
MNKLLLAILLTGVAVPAIAADLPVKAPYAAPVYSDWTGFYLFGFGGYSWGKISPDDFNLSALNRSLHNPKPKGGVFGFGGGYLWQYGAWVGGLEVDYGFSSEKDNQSISQTVGGTTETLALHSKIDALGSARVRAGYLLMPSLLAYGTAGVGWGRSEISITDTLCSRGTQCIVPISLSAKENQFGWVAGGGMEFKLFQHLRLRGEYLHYDFGSTGYSFQSRGITTGGTINAKTRDDVARGALIWSFN